MADDDTIEPTQSPPDVVTPDPSPQVPLAAWVKNGSTSSAHDRMLAEKQADAKRRRAEEDERFRIAQQSPEEAQLRQAKLGGRQTHATVVLGLKHPKDGTIQDWMFCEVTQEMNAQGVIDLTILLQCPRCIRTYGRPPSETIFHIKQSNRPWWLDQRKRDERKPNPLLGVCAGEVFVNPEDQNEVALVAGMVNTNDWCKCPLCSWEFKIEDSVVYTR